MATTRPPRLCDDEWPVDVGSGSVSTRPADSPLADALLEATLLLARLRVLLAEATADDWRELDPRLAGLREAIRSLPKRPPRRRRVGF